MADRRQVSLTYAVPEGYEKSDYDIDKGMFKCPSCGKYKASKYPSKTIGSCWNCGKNLQFMNFSTPFIRVEEGDSVDE